MQYVSDDVEYMKEKVNGSTVTKAGELTTHATANTRHI